MFENNTHEVEILSPGVLNHDAGPDFFNARIKIDNTEWAGNVEIHLKSSDWNNHQHQKDEAYNNVILHVVYEHDKEIKDANGRQIPVLELKNKINHSKYSEYSQFIKPEIPCINQLSEVSPLIILNTKERLLIERLETKCIDIAKAFELNNKDWEETFYQFLMRALGSGLNGDAFFWLAKQTPLKYLRKSDDLTQIESLLFGNAGFLTDTPDEYMSLLNREYSILKHKYQVQSLKKSIWKFSKIRPSNFPTIRLAQAARLIVSKQNLFDSFVRNKVKPEELNSLLDISILDGYWHNHFVFEKESKPQKKSVGLTLRNNIITNVVVPFAFFYGEYLKEQFYKDYAIKLLESIDAEENRYTKKFENKISNESAFDSQALIELSKNYCAQKKCLSCMIGQDILK